MPIKIHIAFKIINSPNGGGNQFLKALKNYFSKENMYTDNPVKADVILFNSHQNIPKVLKFKLHNKKKNFIHRIDGPIRLYNSMDDKRDLVTNYVNEIIADGTIYQSKWSREQNLKMGLPPAPFSTTMMNAPNDDIFNRKNKQIFSTNRKIKLIATSWSDNWKKGFEVYRWLDQNLDFNKYEMNFIGRSPVNFTKIKLLPPKNGSDLAKIIKEHDIFISGSKIECCSNSVLEALHCGLPVVVPNSSSHPSIINEAGKCFEQCSEIPKLLEQIVVNYNKIQGSISLPSLDAVGKEYLAFFKKIYDQTINEQYTPKIPTLAQRLKLKKKIIIAGESFPFLFRLITKGKKYLNIK